MARSQTVFPKQDTHESVGKKTKEKRYTQRAKHGVLRKRVLLPPGLKVTLSDPQLNFIQPVAQKEREERKKEQGREKERKKETYANTQ